MSRTFQSADALADALIDAVGRELVVGLPIGLGKAVHVVDALFARAVDDPRLSLTIFSGLTLEPPRGRGELERRFVAPLVDRLYADWPTPAYAGALRRGSLPSNVRVREFYLRPGGWLGNALVQRNYTSINYSQVVSTLLELGVNVIAQLVSGRPESPGHYSLSANPEITLDLLPRFDARRRAGERVALVGQVNRNLPYMTGRAEIARDRFDFVLDDDRLDFPLFTLPNRRVSAADYATAMHVASLVPDGGTLQLGIGSLSDAVAHCLRLRHHSPEVFAAVLERLPGGSRSARRGNLPIETGSFGTGLFASTELMSDALYALYESGIIRRPADADDPSVVHAGFFLGSTSLYEKLRSLGESRRSEIAMTSISDVNTLYGDEQRKRSQRRKATFINESMMATLLGAAVSDALEGGQVVSGVGGQFDFVSMAHALDEARSVLMVRARRVADGAAQSNIRWTYGHATVPRHHRDVFVTEYGVAATRGLSDEKVIEAMLGIADSAFQTRLMADAKQAGKLAANFSLDRDALDNTPAALQRIFRSPDVRAHFPAYPLGTDLTPSERDLAEALEWLKVQTARPLSTLTTFAAALILGATQNHDEPYARMGLDHPGNFRQRALRRLLGFALDRAGRSLPD